MSKNAKRLLGVCIGVAAGIIISVVLIIHKHFEPQKNIFFLEYENEYEKDDTLIYQYNSESGSVVERGRVQGMLRDCVINNDETYITGMIYGEAFEIVRYDLATGTVETLNAVEKIDILTESKWDNICIYDGGNKVFVGFRDKKQRPKWLLYDLTTDQYDIVEGEYGVIKYLIIDDGCLWYIVNGWSLYKYDLEKKEKTKIMESAYDNSVMMPETGLVAYIKDMRRRDIYLYDIWTQKSCCIAEKNWNTFYGDLLGTNSGWSDNGREFFYIKYFPGLFNEATTKLMVYDVITHRSRCIHEVKMTEHEFQYVTKR